jgi:hypothetical protein
MMNLLRRLAKSAVVSISGQRRAKVVCSLHVPFPTELTFFRSVFSIFYLGEAITALSVQHSDKAPSGDGWKKIDVNLNKTSGKMTYIYFKKDNGSPIIDLKITTSDDQVTGPGFSKVAEELVFLTSYSSFFLSSEK